MENIIYWTQSCKNEFSSYEIDIPNLIFQETKFLETDLRGAAITGVHIRGTNLNGVALTSLQVKGLVEAVGIKIIDSSDR